MKATCTWGDGPDVLVVVEGTPVVLYEKPRHHKPPRGDFKHGYIKEGSFDLTAEEAEIFASNLLGAARQAKELSDSYCEYMKGDKDGSIKRSHRDGTTKKKR